MAREMYFRYKAKNNGHGALPRCQRRYVYRYIAFLMGTRSAPRPPEGMSEVTRAWLEDIACAVVRAEGKGVMHR